MFFKLLCMNEQYNFLKFGNENLLFLQEMDNFDSCYDICGCGISFSFIMGFSILESDFFFLFEDNLVYLFEGYLMNENRVFDNDVRINVLRFDFIEDVIKELK